MTTLVSLVKASSNFVVRSHKFYLLLWFVVSYLVVVSMYVFETSLLEVIIRSLLSYHVVNLLGWYIGAF